MGRTDHFQDITVAGKISIGANASFFNPGGISLDTIFGGKINDIRVVTSESFPTIQSAIDDITDATNVGDNNPGSGGSLVLVPPGVYSESVTGKSNVVVMGYGASTIIRATGNNVTLFGTPTDGTVTWRTGLKNIILDGNGKTGVTGLDLVNTRVSEFEGLQCLRGAGSGTAFRLRSNSNNATTQSTTSNHFVNLFAHSWDKGLVMDGDKLSDNAANSGGVITLNTFSGLHLADMTTTGIDLADWVDTNVWLNTRISIDQDGTGVEFNSDDPTLFRGVSRNNFFNLVIDPGGNSSSTVGLKFNYSEHNRVYGFATTFSSPSVSIQIADNNADDNIVDDATVNNTPLNRGFKMDTKLILLPLDVDTDPSNSNDIQLIGRNSGGTDLISTINASSASIQFIPASGGSVILNRIRSSGTAHVTGDYALGGNWGTSPSVSSVAATDHGGRVTVTSGSGAPGASPTLALTFQNGTWTNAPGVVGTRGDTNAPTTAFWALTSISSTVATWTFVGTPSASTAYVLDFTVIGR